MSQTIGDLDRFRSDSFEPLSFRERGATVPFTTPLLLNARIRHSSSNRGREMVVTNPSGGRGALILPWGAMPDICTPTLFDRHLWETLDEAADITPIGIRQDAQRLAAQGLAGRHAAVAARDAQRRDQVSQRLIKSMLLESLIMAMNAGSKTAERLSDLSQEMFQKHAQSAIVRAASMIGIPFAGFVADIESLAVALSGATPQLEGEDARLRQMLDELRRVLDQITDWVADEDRDSGHVMAAQFILESGRITIECAETALAASDSLIADFGFLILDWKKEKDNLLHRARGGDWVLDGWNTPMSLWRAARPHDRRSAIWEMALIAPILPREAKAWIGNVKDWREPRRTTQVVRDKSDWRSGNTLELVARNEKLIGLSISYENQITALAPFGTKPAVTIPQNTAATPAAHKVKIPLSASAQGAAAKSAIGLDSVPPQGLNETRMLGNMVETASDSALTKIVAMIDKMANPDIHQRILGPSLPRLRQLKPPRPASLIRVMFLPLSGALIDPLRWRRQSGRIPRTAISPLMTSFRDMMRPEMDRIEKELRDKTLSDANVISRIGRMAWQAAASLAPRLRPSPAWEALGVTDRDFEAIISLAGGLWRHAGPIWEAWQQMDGACSAEFLRETLTGPAREGRDVFTAALNTLLQRATYPSIFCALMQQMPSEVSGIVERALEGWVSANLAELAEFDLANAARLAEEILQILESLETAPRNVSKLEARDLIMHRRNLDQFCRSTYRDILSLHVMSAMNALTPDTIDRLTDIEAMARLARRFETIGRRIGAGTSLEGMKDGFRKQIQQLEQDAVQAILSPMEFARIREIILGGTPAERFLYRTRRQRLASP